MNELIHSLGPWASAWLANLWRASWQGGLAILAAWAIARWWKSLSPRVTCWIWRVVCLKLLVTLVWVEPVAIPILPAAGTEIAPTIAGIDRAAPHRIDDAAKLSPPQQPRVMSGGPGLTPPIDPEHPISVNTILSLLWATCVAAFIAVTIGTWLSVRRLCGSAVTASSELLAMACRDEANRLGIRRLPRIRLSPRVESPLLIGVWRPTIVLLDRAEESFDKTELRLMFGHELAHLKRHDLLWNWLPTVSGWLFFFHPLVWLLKRCWFEAQEAACDELLIQRQLARPTDYGRLLLKLATRSPKEPRASLAAAGVLGAYRNLERRIQAMTRVKTQSRRRLLVAFGLLALVIALGMIPWQLVAKEPQADKNAPVANKPVAAESAGRGVWLGDATKSSPPTIIIAEHVLLWDNQIVTWDEVLNRLRAMRAAGPFRAAFYFSNAIDHRQVEGFRFWRDRIMAVYPELFSPVGIRMGNLTPQGSIKFDAVRTADDLIPNPERARSGQLLTPDGKPAAGAQIVVIQPSGIMPIMLQGTELRDPLDEQWTRTDEHGRFTVYTEGNEYWIAALHPDGFVLQRGAEKDKAVAMQLQPWAIVTFFSTGEVAGQAADISVRPTRASSEWPEFSIFELKTKGKPLDVKVPAGKIVVRRSLVMKNGGSIGTPFNTFSLAPGEQHTIAMLPATAAERAAAAEDDERMEKRRKTLEAGDDEQSDPKRPVPSKSGQNDKPEREEAPSPATESKPSAASGGESPLDPKEHDSEMLEMQRELERKEAPLLAAMAKEGGYKLDEKQNLRRIAPPFPAIRKEWYRVSNPSLAQQTPAGPTSVVFRWSNDRLANREAQLNYSGPVVIGNSLEGLLYVLLGVKKINVEGLRELLYKPIPGDWVVRMDATDEQVAKALTAILRKELAFPVRLEFRTVERPVYVAEGVYRHKPVPGGRDKGTVIRSDKTITTDAIEIFGKELVPNVAGGSAGKFQTFLDWLGDWIGTPIVSDVKEPPRGELSWLMRGRLAKQDAGRPAIEAEDRDPNLVLANITAQTGLSFRKETRRVRILFVSRE